MKERSHYINSVTIVVLMEVGTLKRHEDSVHEGKKPYQCNVSFVINGLPKKVALINRLRLFMEERSNLNVNSVTIVVLKKIP